MLTYIETSEESGNSVVLVVITKNNYNKEIIRDELKELNCDSEGLNNSYFAVEIPKKVDYSTINNILTKYENLDILEYAEPCISKKHRNDNSK